MNFKFGQFFFLFFVCLAFNSTTGISSSDIDSESNIIIVFNEPYDVCYNDQVQIAPIISGGNGAYTYQWSNGDILATTNAPQFPNSQIAGNYQYMLTVTDGVGCTAVATVSYTIFQEVSHTLFATADSACLDGVDDGVEICAQISTGLANSPLTYNWIVNPDLNYTLGINCITIDDEGSVPGFYQIMLEVTDIFGCIYQEGPVFLSVENSPQINQFAPTCIANPNGNAEYSVELCGTGGAFFEWYLYDEDCAIQLDGPYAGNCVSFFLIPFAEGDVDPVTFCVEAVDQSTGCSSFESFTIEPPKTPDVPLLIEGCPNEAVTITLGNPEEFTSWTWCDGVSIDTSYQFVLEGNESCFITVVENNFCEQSYEIEVNTAFADHVGIIGSTEFCLGGSTTLCAGSNPENEYSWSTGETTECITVSVSGIYIVQITQDFCVIVDQVTVAEIIDLTVNVAVSNLCVGNSTILSAEDSYTDYEWTNEDGNVIEPLDVMEPWKIEVSQAGTYTLTFSDGSCNGEAVFIVNPIEPPSATIEMGFVCNDINSGMPTSLDLSTLITDASDGFSFFDPFGNPLPMGTYEFEGLEAGFYVFSVVVDGESPCMSAEFEVLVEVSDCTTATEDLIPFAVSVYPNPTIDILFVDTEESDLSYQVYNVTGVMIKEGNLSKREITFREIEAGIYFVKFTKDGRTRVERVVKM